MRQLFTRRTPQTRPVRDLVEQRLARRCDGELVQLGGDPGAVGIGLSRSETLAEGGDLVLPGAAAANLRAAAGC